jgi:hypothetical protein
VGGWGQPERRADGGISGIADSAVLILAFGFFWGLPSHCRQGLGGWVVQRTYFRKMGLRQSFNSGLISVISIPGMTMNLQLSISRGLSSSGNLAITRQYWQS